mmetsp:Transcript_8650/g.20201  ORF Transcript_8650/g.20201 Transcript_8650/m.20201 type:complete len:220 (-) Transcript_8650:624-1283(-)
MTLCAVSGVMRREERVGRASTLSIVDLHPLFRARNWRASHATACASSPISLSAPAGSFFLWSILTRRETPLLVPLFIRSRVASSTLARHPISLAAFVSRPVTFFPGFHPLGVHLGRERGMMPFGSAQQLSTSPPATRTLCVGLASDTRSSRSIASIFFARPPFSIIVTSGLPICCRGTWISSHIENLSMFCRLAVAFSICAAALGSTSSLQRGWRAPAR